MSDCVNKAIIEGVCTEGPEIRNLGNGERLAKMIVTTYESLDDKGQKQHIELHNVCFLCDLAETAERHIKKGTRVYIEGILRTNRHPDVKNGERYYTVIIAHELRIFTDNNPAANTQTFH